MGSGISPAAMACPKRRDEARRVPYTSFCRLLYRGGERKRIVAIPDIFLGVVFLDDAVAWTLFLVRPAPLTLYLCKPMCARTMAHRSRLVGGTSPAESAEFELELGRDGWIVVFGWRWHGE
jgi:hypothetical protein